MGGEFIRLAFRTGKTLTLEDQNFDIFASSSDEPVLSINLPDTIGHGPHLAYCLDDHHNGIDVLSRLCQKVRTPS